MSKFEISHYLESKNHMQYNTYHNCENAEEAIVKHEMKGFLKSNIKNITKHTKYKYSNDELKELLK